jgi:hypothetical protein
MLGLGATSPTSTAAAGTATTAAAPRPRPNGLADLPPILPGWEPRRARPAASPADGSAIRYRDLTTQIAGPAASRA